MRALGKRPGIWIWTWTSIWMGSWIRQTELYSLTRACLAFNLSCSYIYLLLECTQHHAEKKEARHSGMDTGSVLSILQTSMAQLSGDYVCYQREAKKESIACSSSKGTRKGIHFFEHRSSVLSTIDKQCPLNNNNWCSHLRLSA